MERLKRLLLHKGNPDLQREVFVGSKPTEEELRKIQEQQMGPKVPEETEQYEMIKKRLQEQGPTPLDLRDREVPEIDPEVLEQLEMKRRLLEKLLK